ncbi:MAG: heavy metal-binding domain-containing protein [Gemmatimonadota bacterium]
MPIELFTQLVGPGILLLGTWITGRLIERRHFDDLLRLESGSTDILALTVESVPASWVVVSSDLAMGNVVISQDYFKRVVAGLKGVVGGQIGVYEPLLERARREALVRLKEDARARGHDTIINVRIETAPLARSRGGDGTAGVEILAFGTAITVAGGRTPTMRGLPQPE